MRKNIVATCAIILIFIFSISLIADETLYGPKDISVKKNKKKKVNKASFKATDGLEGQITITNGVDGKVPANSVTIVLNGKRIVTKKQVNAKTETYTGTITLKTKNKLKITVKKKSAAIRVLITGKESQERGIFDKVIGIGDSILAGVQDATLEEPTQMMSYGPQIAEALGVDFILPLISEPGIPARIIKMVNGKVTFPPLSGDGQRINPDVQPDNLGVPGAATGDILRTRTLSGDFDYYTAILGGNKTMLDHAKELKPTFIIFWIGSNDALEMALETDPDRHTPIAEFAADYETVLKELQALGAKFVTLNVPDISTVGYLIDPADFISFPLVPAGHKVAATALIDFAQNGTIPTFTDDEILTPEELAQISATVDELNVQVKRLTRKYNVPLIDAHAILSDIHANGIVIDEETLTTKLFGGFYSLDGVHPSDTGQAILSNHIIRRINKEFGQNIPLVDVEAVFADDPNRPSENPFVGPANFKRLDKKMFENLKRMLVKAKHARQE